LRGWTKVATTSIAIVAAGAVSACGTNRSASTTTTTSDIAAPTTWHIQASANSSTGHNVLNAATVVDHVALAVGDFFNGISDRTMVERENAGAWAVEPSPNASPKHNELDAVSGTSLSDVWAVGRYAPDSGQERTLVEHFNGATWSVVPSPNVGQYHNELDGVAAIAPSDVWAVGHFDERPQPADKALIEHWDGHVWSIVAAPRFLDPVSDLNAVSATPKGGPVWAVGSEQIADRATNLVLELLNGVWRVVPSPDHGPYSNALLGVAAISAKDMWAVGAASHLASSTAVSVHYDGLDVDLVAVPRRLATHYVLNAVAGDGQHRLFAAGDFFSGRADEPVILQWSGEAWILARTPSGGDLHHELLSVATATKNAPIAVGKYFTGSADQTLVLRCTCGSNQG
jgi:hypothetical protein